MFRLLRRSVPTVTVSAVLAGSALALPATASAADAQGPCPKYKAVVSADRVAGAVFFRVGSDLWSCGEWADPDRPSGTIHTTLRAGPWEGRRASGFDGRTAVWAIRKRLAGGALVDQVWAARAGERTLLRGARPTVGPQAADDRLVAGLKVVDGAAAWLTTRSTLVMYVPDAEGAPDPVGAGTTGAIDPPPSSGETGPTVPQGLLVPSVSGSHHRAVIGRWERFPSTSLVKSLRLEAKDQPSECGGRTRFTATVKVGAEAPRVGAAWAAGYSTATDPGTSPDCG